MQLPVSFRMSFAALAIALATASPSIATTIYSNSTNDIVTRFVYSGKEIGDEIILAGTDRVLTNFSFEFSAPIFWEVRLSVEHRSIGSNFI